MARGEDQLAADTGNASEGRRGAREMPEVLTVDEVTELLRVDRKSVYAAIQRGEIPGVVRLGRVIRLSRDAVLQWLSQGQGRVPRSRTGK